MTPRDEKGRFVRADAKPVLHREPPARIDHGPRIDAWLVILIAVAALGATVLGIALFAYDGGLL